MNFELRMTSLIDSLIDSLIPSFIDSFIDSFIYWFLPSFIHSFIHYFIHSFLHSFLHSFIPSSLHSFIHSFLHSFVRCIYQQPNILAGHWQCTSLTVTHLYGSANKNSSWIASRKPVLKEQKKKNPGSRPARKSIWHKSRQLVMSYFHYSVSN